LIQCIIALLDRVASLHCCIAVSIVSHGLCGLSMVCALSAMGLYGEQWNLTVPAMVYRLVIICDMVSHSH